MKPTFAVLDGIRGIAALFVVVIHTPNFWNGVIFPYSFLAVDLFFLLSGFVIAHAYERKLEEGLLSKIDFAKIRLIRFYPMYLISILFSVLVFIIQNAAFIESADSITRSIIPFSLTLFFIPSVLNDSILLFPLNRVYWSLFYELIVNGIYVLIRSQLSNRSLSVILFVLGLTLIAMSYLHGTINAGSTWRKTSIAAGLVRSGFGIFLGIFIYRYYQRTLSKNSKPITSIFKWLPLVAICSILAIPDIGKPATIDLLAVFIVFPISILYSVKARFSAGTEKIFVILGISSYPVYLLHYPISQLIEYFFKSWIKDTAPVSGFALLLFLIFVAYFFERKFDMPVRKTLLNHMLNR